MFLPRSVLPRLAVGLHTFLGLALLPAYDLLTSDQTEGVPDAAFKLNDGQEAFRVIANERGKVNRALKELLVKRNIDGLAAILLPDCKVAKLAVKPMEDQLVPDKGTKSGNRLPNSTDELLGDANRPLHPRIRLHDHDAILDYLNVRHMI